MSKHPTTIVMKRYKQGFDGQIGELIIVRLMTKEDPGTLSSVTLVNRAWEMIKEAVHDKWKAGEIKYDSDPLEWDTDTRSNYFASVACFRGVHLPVNRYE